jgi:hypothetical protein
LLVAGCGGRDPLYGEVDPGVVPATPQVGVDAGAGGGATARDAARDTIAIMVPPSPPADAGIVFPPTPVRDAGATPRTDASTGTPPINSCMLPPCLEKVASLCTPAGSCMQQRAAGGGPGGTNTCYANGVKYLATVTGNGRNQDLRIRVTRPDGNTCYTVESSNRGGGVSALTYRGPAGEMVATATVERGGLLAVTCTGEMVPRIISSACQPGVMTGGTSCTPGMCQ